MDKKLKMSLIKFFHDRPDLVHLIEQNDYQKSDIPLLVNAFNEPDKYKLLPMQKK